MRLPNVISAGLLAVLLFALQWALSHIGEFSIPPAYLEIATGLLGVTIAAVAKIATEPRQPTATARGAGEAQSSYLARVLYK